MIIKTKLSMAFLSLAIIAAPAVAQQRSVEVVYSDLNLNTSAGIAAFLAANPGWQAQAPDLPLGRPRGAGLRLTPFHDGTDGFFIAGLGKP